MSFESAASGTERRRARAMLALGVDLRLVAPLLVNTPGIATNGLVVRKDLVDGERYRDARDLKGMTVAVPVNTYRYHLDRLATSGGLTLDDLSLELMAPPDAI